MQVVWFKRDLRIHDHWPLARAAKVGCCLCLYVYEPELLGSAEFDSSHLEFINQSLHELDQQLRKLGGRLTIRVGAMPEVLDELHHQEPIEQLWSHLETGNRLTYDRDLRVASWAKQKGVSWTEVKQNGVIRRLASRDGWAEKREQFLREPMAPIPESIYPAEGIDTGGIHTAAQLGLPENQKDVLQTGGEQAGQETLDSFLQQRGEHYNTEMSSPVTAVRSCSRLSPYLAWGCLSMKQVHEALGHRTEQLKEMRGNHLATGNWLKGLRSFRSRLSWHCHFMQKLEDEPSIEFENMSRIYDGLREDEFKQSYFDAWCHGQTGYPMVDACMRALHQTGWINFRMRAMLVSFASYHLWLHWRPTAVFLGKHFLDFEPGIHFSQFQMQSGTTGINTVRIYSPIKQVTDQDPTGIFIRKYVPELANVPDKYLAQPHKMTAAEQSTAGCEIGKDYPHPIVDHATEYKRARQRLYGVRGSQVAKAEAQRVVKKHGSRKRTVRNKTGARSAQRNAVDNH